MYILLFSTTHLWNMRVYDGNNYPSQHGNNIPSYRLHGINNSQTRGPALKLTLSERRKVYKKWETISKTTLEITKKLLSLKQYPNKITWDFLGIFLAFDFCRFCAVIWFFHPRHKGQWSPTSKDFYTRSYPLHFFLILILEVEPLFPFSVLSAKQGNYWYHF